MDEYSLDSIITIIGRFYTMIINNLKIRPKFQDKKPFEFSCEIELEKRKNG